MTSAADSLLRRLAGVVAPGPTRGAAGPENTPGLAGSATATGAPAFAELFRQAQRGEVASGLNVSVSPRLKVDLSPQQLQRLSLAADKAQAAGLRHALVLIDGVPLKLDVVSRTVTEVVNPSESVVRGIDGFVAVADANAEAAGQETGVLPLPEGQIGGPESLKQLISTLKGRPGRGALHP